MIKRFFDSESVWTAARGIVGMSATGGGFYVSILPKVEAWLRIISLIIGIAVGIVSFISIVRTKTKSRKPHRRSFLDLLE